LKNKKSHCGGGSLTVEKETIFVGEVKEEKKGKKVG